MRKVLIGCLLFALWAMPAAEAGPTFDWFGKFCVAGNADQSQSLAAADAAGWMPVPNSLQDQLRKSREFQDVSVRMRTSEAGVYLLISGNGVLDFLPGVTLHICGVVVMAEPPESMVEEATAFAAVPSKENETTSIFWIWREQNGVHIPIDYKMSDRDGRALLEGNDTRILVLMRKEKSSTVILAVPAKNEPPK